MSRAGQLFCTSLKTRTTKMTHNSGSNMSKLRTILKLKTAKNVSLISNGGFEVAGTGGADIFAAWTENVGNGAIAVTTTAGEFRSGTSAVKLTAGTTFNTYVLQAVPASLIVSGGTYRFTGWARGNGTNSGRVRIFQGAADLLAVSTISIPGTSYAQWTRDVVVGAGAVSFYCYCPGTNGAISYFDDVSVYRIA